MRRRSAPTVIEADSRTDGSPPPHPAGDEERRGAVTPPYGSTTGGAQQPRAIPQSRLRRASSCCGAQNSLLAYAHRILTTATPFCSLLPPLAALANVPLYTREPLGRGDADCRVASLLAMTVLNLCHSEEAQRADVGIRPFYDGRWFGPPRSSAPTEGLPKSQQRADVPKAWPPPTKFRAEIWGVSHRHRPLRVVAESCRDLPGSA